MASATAAAEDDGKLPLKGVRVLDMTRVLAGVCGLFHCSLRSEQRNGAPKLIETVAVLYTDSGRPGVSSPFHTYTSLRNYWEFLAYGEAYWGRIESH